jgi:2-polyprenyl-3-methyl-5-hydroxy-6-metoxy-1,4-benzoquinol methylase
VIEVSSCPLCAAPASESAQFDARVFRGRPVSNRLCRRCGLVYQSPRPGAAELDAFYEEEYRLLYQGSAEPNPKDLAVQRGRAQALLGFLRQAGAAPQRALDIGCSAGVLLEGLRLGGAAVAGVEPGAAYREYAASRGLCVYASLNELEAQCPGERFDLISLAHVIEHLPDPAAYLTALRSRWLAADGLLLVETPNLYAHDCFEVAHLTAFSAHTLAQTLARAGFASVQQRLHGLPRSALIPLYLTVLARPAAAQTAWQPSAEAGVALKRRLGLLRRGLLARLFPRRAWLKPGEEA